MLEIGGAVKMLSENKRRDFEEMFDSFLREVQERFGISQGRALREIELLEARYWANLQAEFALSSE